GLGRWPTPRLSQSLSCRQDPCAWTVSSCVGAANHLVPRSVQFLALRDILSLSDIYFSWPPAEHHSSNLNATEQCSNSGGTWVRHRPPCAQVSTPGGDALP